MDKDDTQRDDISESELLGLLSSMKVQPAPETDFESRFLYDLRERLARESVCCSARRLLWDHVVQLLMNFGPRKLAYGASTLGLGALAVGFYALPGDETAASGVVAAAKTPLTRLERSMASFRPTCDHGPNECTAIRICEQKRTPYTETSLATGRSSMLFEHSASPASANASPASVELSAPMTDIFAPYASAVGF